MQLTTHIGQPYIVPTERALSPQLEDENNPKTAYARLSGEFVLRKICKLKMAHLEESNDLTQDATKELSSLFRKVQDMILFYEHFKIIHAKNMEDYKILVELHAIDNFADAIPYIRSEGESRAIVEFLPYLKMAQKMISNAITHPIVSKPLTTDSLPKAKSLPALKSDNSSIRGDIDLHAQQLEDLDKAHKINIFLLKEDIFKKMFLPLINYTNGLKEIINRGIGVTKETIETEADILLREINKGQLNRFETIKGQIEGLSSEILKLRNGQDPRRPGA